MNRELFPLPELETASKMENYIEQIIRRDFCIGSVVQFLQTTLLILKSRTKEVIVYMAVNP